ncbi:hypothetical protein DL769_008866 [Monosporascus sp. CRB-8-3]|nr:hypothetical protein DL769_008866 [Monosporascus sp. CRB-8-3]
MFGTKKPPQNFEEEYRAENYRFERYRTEGIGALTDDELADQRSVWMGRPFPRYGHPPAIRSEKVQGYSERRMARRQRNMPSLLGNSPHDNDPGFTRARQRFREARDWFLAQGPFDFIRPLGYGGLGLTIQFRSRGENPIDVVLKIALDGWVDDDLRNEERATRQLAGAAHCIQLIDPERIGMKKQQPYKFARSELIDSSSEGGLSGDESPGDEPPKKVQRTRRARLADKEEASRMRKRLRQRVKRDAEMEEKIEERERRLERRRKAGGKGKFIGGGDDDDEWQLDHKDYLLLEFVENGDLSNFIMKLNEKNLRVPNRILWSFWLCLVRACVAMEYPPRKFHPRRRPKDAEGEPPNAALAALALDDDDRDLNGKIVDGQLFEDVPGPKRSPLEECGIIDTGEVFIGGFDVNAKDDEHLLVPRLKLADFGTALNVKPNKSNEYYFCKRFQAKRGYFAPEQFGIEWDYVAPTDPFGPELSEQTVAGNYGAPMNIWGIALTLWNVITKCYPPIPPQRQPGPGPLTYCHLIRTDPKYNYVDPELKEVLAQCMRHDPKDRPSLLNLSRQAKKGIKKRYGNESDDFIWTWIHNVLYNASSS